ncbi:hypothetical protein FA95DRAFT_900589 [Auriscalpium vulgare]|uniref:Uncharacterized protein n=1 Tax=Auriscalpium vulgare TaxID=40419 RepID=A0ACB8R8N5_9AGAM|nr:hypothetical protein FA95DRAFT_900589 [Auriscalpium vulgare]
MAIDTKVSAVGYVYIRAHATCDIQELVRLGAPVLYLLRKHVPLLVDDTTDSTPPSQPTDRVVTTMRKGQHVRIISGRYDGDLAIVLAVAESDRDAVLEVAVVPRFWTTPERRRDLFDGGDPRHRPEAHPFDSIGRLPSCYDGDVITWDDSNSESSMSAFWGHTFIHGCLILRRPISEVNLFPEPPSVWELEPFDHVCFRIWQPLRALAQSRLRSRLTEGDRVRVVHGELIHTVGSVFTCGEDTVHMDAGDANIVEVPFAGLERAFEPGDLVEISSGNETQHGIVEAVGTARVYFVEIGMPGLVRLPTSTEVCPDLSDLWVAIG